MNSLYVLKTKGGERIADYVQLRDEDFVLVDHVKLSDIGKFFRKHTNCCVEDLIATVHTLPYGKLLKIETD